MTLLTLAAIIGAHGIRGEVRLKLFGDGPAGLAGLDEVLIGGQPRRLRSVSGSGKAIVARIAGVSDRAAAEALRGALIEVPRDALPPLAEGEYYHVDLLGLRCEDAGGTPLGTVVAVENYGAGDLLEVEAEGGRKSLIPFRAGIADRDGDRIVLDPEFLA